MEKNKFKILIIDNDANFVNKLVSNFDLFKYDIFFASDGSIGLNLSKKIHPDYIFLDINIPVMDGIRMLRLLRADDWGKNANVIILTNSFNDIIIRSTLKLYAHDYLLKNNNVVLEILNKLKVNTL